MKPKVLKTDRDHQAALAHVEALMDKASPDKAELELWSLLVEKYEEEHFPIATPDPIEAIRFRMEQEGLTTKDLLPIFKTRARASEVMAKKRRLNLPMIRRLHARLSIPIECLVQEYKLKRTPGAGGKHRIR
jgi:HTH-type transcriptional regulator / antitoxin HigA